MSTGTGKEGTFDEIETVEEEEHHQNEASHQNDESTSPMEEDGVVRRSRKSKKGKNDDEDHIDEYEDEGPNDENEEVEDGINDSKFNDNYDPFRLLREARRLEIEKARLKEIERIQKEAEAAAAAEAQEDEDDADEYEVFFDEVCELVEVEQTSEEEDEEVDDDEEEEEEEQQVICRVVPRRVRIQVPVPEEPPPPPPEEIKKDTGPHRLQRVTSRKHIDIRLKESFSFQFDMEDEFFDEAGNRIKRLPVEEIKEVHPSNSQTIHQKKKDTMGKYAFMMDALNHDTAMDQDNDDDYDDDYYDDEDDEDDEYEDLDDEGYEEEEGDEDEEELEEEGLADVKERRGKKRHPPKKLKAHVVEKENEEETIWSPSDVNLEGGGNWIVLEGGNEDLSEEMSETTIKLRQRKLSVIEFEKESLIIKYLRIMQIHRRLHHRNAYLQNYLYKLCIRKKLIIPPEEQTRRRSTTTLRKEQKIKRQNKKTAAKMKANFETFVSIKANKNAVKRIPTGVDHARLRRAYKSQQPCAVPPAYEEKIDLRVVNINGELYQRVMRSKGRNWIKGVESDETKRELLAIEAKNRLYHGLQKIRLAHPTTADTREARTIIRHRDLHPHYRPRRFQLPGSDLPRPQRNPLDDYDEHRHHHQPHHQHSHHHHDMQSGHHGHSHHNHKEVYSHQSHHNQHHHQHHSPPHHHQHVIHPITNGIRERKRIFPSEDEFDPNFDFSKNMNSQRECGGDSNCFKGLGKHKRYHFSLRKFKNEHHHHHQDHQDHIANIVTTGITQAQTGSAKQSKALAIFRKASKKSETAIPVLTRVTKGHYCRRKPRAHKKFRPLNWFYTVRDGKIKENRLRGRKFNGEDLLQAEKHHLVNFVKQMHVTVNEKKKALKMQAKRQAKHIQQDWSDARERVKGLLEKKLSMEQEHATRMEEKTLEWSFWAKRNKLVEEGLLELFQGFVRQSHFSKATLRQFQPDIDEFAFVLNKCHMDLMCQLEKMYQCRLHNMMLQRKVKDKTNNQDLIKQGLTLYDLELRINDNKILYEKLQKRELDLSKQKEQMSTVIKRVVLTRDFKDFTEKNVTEAYGFRKLLLTDAHEGARAVRGAIRQYNSVQKYFKPFLLQASIVNKPLLLRDFKRRKNALSHFEDHKRNVAREVYLRERELNMIHVKMKDTRRRLIQEKETISFNKFQDDMRTHHAKINGKLQNLIEDTLSKCKPIQQRTSSISIRKLPTRRC